jgi:SAM-dependent methyltransferase
MKTDWDYTELAQAYLKRPNYSEQAIDALCRLAAPNPAEVCDVGAGAGHLTRMLASRGHRVTAIEPNPAMSALGRSRTAGLPDLRWVEAVAEASGQDHARFDLVTFGSSFNVCDRPRALAEAARILRRGGWLALVWNHRRLDDPLQARIEAFIRSSVPSYSHGVRREDQAPVIAANKSFATPIKLAVDFVCHQSVDDCVEAWASHATLARAAGERFGEALAGIAALLRQGGEAQLSLPYTTVLTLAQRI